MPSIGGRPSADEFEERGVDHEDDPPVGFATDRLSKIALVGTFPFLWLLRYGGVTLWLAIAFAGCYLLVTARALQVERPLAALGWALYLPALAFGSGRVLPSVGPLVGAALVVVGLVTVAYADHRYRRDEHTKTTA